MPEVSPIVASSRIFTIVHVVATTIFKDRLELFLADLRIRAQRKEPVLCGLLPRRYLVHLLMISLLEETSRHWRQRTILDNWLVVLGNMECNDVLETQFGGATGLNGLG